MSKGGGSKTTTKVEINPELKAASQQALRGAEDLFGQGTSGIYQGTRLADLDPLVRQAQEQQLAYANGDLNNMLGMQQQQFNNLLSAGNLEGNDVFQNQLESALEGANVAFQRGSVPLFQQATAAGQYGGSELGEGLGLFGGEINRNLQNQIANIAANQQQIGLQAQALAPQAAALGLLPSQIQQDVGNQRSALAQAQLENEIQQYNAPRNAQVQAQAEFQNFLASNPLIGETTQTSKTKSSSNPLQSALGIGLGVAGLGGDSLGGSFFSGLFGGGGQSSAPVNINRPFGYGIDTSSPFGGSLFDY